MTGHEHPRPESISAAVDTAILEDYLNQHLLGSSPGVPAFRAAADTWKGTPQEPVLRELAEGVERNQEHLEELIRRLGFSVSVTTRAAGAVAAVGGRLNPVNAIRSRESGWTQVELDVLVGALMSQSEMWRVLELLAPHVQAVDGAEAARMHARVLDQVDRLKQVTDETLAGRFLGR